MILSFKTKINGKPTYFVEKIWMSLKPFSPAVNLIKINDQDLSPYFKRKHFKPKIHTIRKDEKNRWKPGMMIDFFINARQKDMFQFAPRIQLVSTQDIFMTRRGSMLEITIAKVGSYIGGDDFYLNFAQMEQLAANDGFDDYDDFRNYFSDAIEENGKATGNYWFSGKILHWTDFKY